MHRYEYHLFIIQNLPARDFITQSRPGLNNKYHLQVIIRLLTKKMLCFIYIKILEESQTVNANVNTQITNGVLAVKI